MNYSKSLIITGDDYGLCAPVNRAIEECLAAGTMGATCVMANMPLCAEAAGLRRRFPGRSIGIHWNITQGRPVTEPASVPSLVDADGRFAPELRRRWLWHRVDWDEVRTELRAQYRRLSELVGPADFWNSHQNVDAFPGLFRLFVEVGEELGIPAMRCHRRFSLPKDNSAARYRLSHPVFWLKGELLARWSASAAARGMHMPDGRVHLPGQRAELALLDQLAARLPWQRIGGGLEWVTHPATSAEEPLLGTLTESRLREYELLRQPACARRMNDIGLRSITFAALAAAPAAAERETANQEASRRES